MSTSPIHAAQAATLSALDQLLAGVGVIPPAAEDLARVAASVYATDCASPRPTTFSRRLSVVLQLREPALWDGTGLLTSTEELLGYLTGDIWTLSLAPDTLAPRDPTGSLDTAGALVLLSGGLDSFCGAVLELAACDAGDRLFLSHSDSRPVAASQLRTVSWLRSHVAPDLRQLTARLWTAARPEPSTRSRSFLFVGLAVAVAAGIGAGRVIVPENGFTSLNPPLTPNRAGALTTRSTHPWTFWRLRQILADLGVSVALENPYEWLTKGELVRETRARATSASLEAGIATTFSCAKLGGNYYGTSPHMNCGLCVACLVRRASIITDGHRDPTDYSCDHAAGDHLGRLIRDRRGDIAAVTWATEGRIVEAELAATASFPPGFDFDAAVDLCNRGIAELAQVPLPDV